MSFATRDLHGQLANLAILFADRDESEPITVDAEVRRAVASVLVFLSAAAPRARSGLELKAMLGAAAAHMLRGELDARLPDVAKAT